MLYHILDNLWGSVAFTWGVGGLFSWKMVGGGGQMGGGGGKKS